MGQETTKNIAQVPIKNNPNMAKTSRKWTAKCYVRQKALNAISTSSPLFFYACIYLQPLRHAYVTYVCVRVRVRVCLYLGEQSAACKYWLHKLVGYSIRTYMPCMHIRLSLYLVRRTTCVPAAPTAIGHYRSMKLIRPLLFSNVLPIYSYVA